MRPHFSHVSAAADDPLSPAVDRRTGPRLGLHQAGHDPGSRARTGWPGGAGHGRRGQKGGGWS